MRLLKSLALLGALALLVGACGGEYGQSSIDPKTDFAQEIDGLYRMIFIWTLIILAIVWALLAYVLVRFRDRPDAPEPRQIHGNLALEIAWTIGPAIIVVAIAVPTIQTVFASQRGDPESSLVVEVVGHQYWWEFRYPDQEVVTANELHLPVGVPVSLRIHSADVIHSFWVPQLGGKRDANPLVRKPEGESLNYNWIHFTVLEPGVYMGQCAEFCGDSHSLMGMRVVAESPEEFEAWLDDWRAAGGQARADVGSGGASPGEPGTDEIGVGGAPAGAADGFADAEAAVDGGAGAAPAASDPQQLPEGLDPQVVAQGREVFHSQTCVACHAIEGTNAQGVLGPNLTLMGRRSRIAAGWLENSVENLERWIRAPRDIKPGVLMPGVDEAGGNWPATALSDEQVRAVAQYLYSLR